MDIATRALHLGFKVIKFEVRLGVGALKAVVGLISGHEEPQPAPDLSSERPAPRPTPRPAPRPAPSARPAPERPAVATNGTSTESVHIDTEPELVAEFAEEGAEEGAGPEIHVDEPWGGYRRMKVADIQERVALAGMAELAVVQLYESTHRNRRSILDAVEKRSRALANEPR
jgi:hypothetical protein